GGGGGGLAEVTDPFPVSHDAEIRIRYCILRREIIMKYTYLFLLILFGSEVRANGQDCGWYGPVTLIATISGDANNPDVTLNDEQLISGDCKSVNGAVVVPKNQSIMDNEYYEPSMPYTMSNDVVTYIVRQGITFSHTPRTWNRFVLTPEQWHTYGPQTWSTDWLSHDFKQLGYLPSVHVDPSSVLAGSVPIPLTKLGTLYVWDLPIKRIPLINFYVQGNVYVQGSCNVQPATLEVDFGDIKGTGVQPQNTPFTITCANASTRGYQVFINGVDSVASNVKVRASDNAGVDVVLRSEKISEMDEGKVINMNLKASLENATAVKPYGVFNASAFMDIRVP
ncbi:hypothetical protein, partial [Serratia marcescens]